MTTPDSPVPECKESVREPTYKEVTELYNSLDFVEGWPNTARSIKECDFIVAYRDTNIDQAIKLYRELKGEDNKPEPEECNHEWKVESGFCQFVNVKCTKCGAEGTVEG